MLDTVPATHGAEHERTNARMFAVGMQAYVHIPRISGESRACMVSLALPSPIARHARMHTFVISALAVKIVEELS